MKSKILKSSKQKLDYMREYNKRNRERIRAYMKEYGKEYYKRNKKKLSKQAKQRRLENIEKYKRIQKTYYERNKKKIIAKQRSYKLKKIYGLTEEVYDSILKEQKNRCAVRGCKETKLFVDHCHKTGKVRGLICHKHNAGIGLIGDTYKDALAVVEYLIRSKEK